MNNTAKVLVVTDSEKAGNWRLGRQEYPKVSQNTAIVLTGIRAEPPTVCFQCICTLRPGGSDVAVESDTTNADTLPIMWL
jgi:hypothetical protein